MADRNRWNPHYDIAICNGIEAWFSNITILRDYTRYPGSGWE